MPTRWAAGFACARARTSAEIVRTAPGSRGPSYVYAAWVGGRGGSLVTEAGVGVVSVGLSRARSPVEEEGGPGLAPARGGAAWMRAARLPARVEGGSADALAARPLQNGASPAE